jgi:hypothetical protein
MQLSSTLFGLVVLQIRPQMEKLLRLPVDCLAKEIQLTQDLMKLFNTYQIPSDLLTFRGTGRSDFIFHDFFSPFKSVFFFFFAFISVLFSFMFLRAGPESNPDEQVACVRGYVRQIEKVIQDAQDHDLKEQARMYAGEDSQILI